MKEVPKFNKKTARQAFERGMKWKESEQTYVQDHYRAVRSHPITNYLKKEILRTRDYNFASTKAKIISELFIEHHYRAKISNIFFNNEYVLELNYHIDDSFVINLANKIIVNEPL